MSIQHSLTSRPNVLVFAGINALCGVGLLSVPYALEQGGWSALSVLLIFSIFSFYTGLLLRYCLDSEPGLETYPDIGQAAFGTTGRVIISVYVYFACYNYFPSTSIKTIRSYLLTSFIFSIFPCVMQIILYMELYVSTDFFSVCI